MVLPRLLDALPEGSVGTLAADGAYDTRGVYQSMEAHGVERSLVKPPERARPWKATTPGAHPRNDLLDLSTRTTNITTGSAAWKRLTGYSVRSLIETSYSRLAALGTSRPRSRSNAGRAGEIATSIELLNLYARTGLPERYRRHWKPAPPA